MANPQIKSQKIHGKSYAMVHDRVNYFRGEAMYKDLGIETEVVHFSEEHCVVRAFVRDKDGFILASGIAHEWKLDPKSAVNKTSFVENAETSAIGRAMACLGIGIEDAYASAFEVELAKASEGSSRKDPQTSKSNVIQHPKSGKPSQVSEMLGEEADPEPEPEQSSDCKAVLSILNRCKTKQDVEGAVNDKRDAVKALPINEQKTVIALKDKLMAELIDDDMPVWD
tara:strand:- start:1271 stop:1948 length:678 start_codon:yes stop_codon:yes gene_type:complete